MISVFTKTASLIFFRKFSIRKLRAILDFAPSICDDKYEKEIMVTQELINIIADKYKQGEKKEQIVESLMSAGWEEKDIEAAIVELRRVALHQLPIISYFSERMATLDKKTSNVNLRTWIIVLILLALFVAGLAFFLNDIIDPLGQKALRRDDIRQEAFSQLQTALSRYRHDNNSYPKVLIQLVPAYISTMPLDPSTHQPYAYKLLDDKTNFELCVEYEQFNSQCVSSQSYEIKATEEDEILQTNTSSSSSSAIPSVNAVQLPVITISPTPEEIKEQSSVPSKRVIQKAI
jgi:hypothetical protein